MRIALIAAFAVLPLASVYASEDEHHELGAHTHGHGTFNVAIEGNSLAMELEAPGMDIVGFEHKPETDVQTQALAAARATLQDVTKVVTLPPAAGCTLQKATAEFHIEDDEKSKPEKSKEASEGHGEFHAEYQLTCTAPERLTGMTFAYFETFNAADELEVTVIGPKQQLKFEVRREAPKIALGGIM